jgi:hypothetical protein
MMNGEFDDGVAVGIGFDGFIVAVGPGDGISENCSNMSIDNNMRSRLWSFSTSLT